MTRYRIEQRPQDDGDYRLIGPDMDLPGGGVAAGVIRRLNELTAKTERLQADEAIHKATLQQRNEAWARIDILQEEVERLREERRWRDADKEWPAGTEWCLCRWREPTELMCLWFDGHGDWRDFGGEVQYPMYWMPLPAPPVEEE